MFCKNCGNQVGGGERFCSKYGTAVMTKRKRMMKRIFSIALCLCLLSTVLCSCDLLSKPKSDEQLIDERIDQFLRAFNTGDFEGVLACMDAKSRRAAQSAINIGEGILDMLDYGGIKLADLFGLSVGLSENDEVVGIQIYSAEIGETTATLLAHMTYRQTFMGASQSYKEDWKIEMLKEEGDWFIHDCTTYYGTN